MTSTTLHVLSHGVAQYPDEPEQVIRAAQPVPRCPISEDAISNGLADGATDELADGPAAALIDTSRPRSSSPRPPASCCRAAAFSASSSSSSWADPTCSIVRDPRREPYTICTAQAPDAVLTVRT